MVARFEEASMEMATLANSEIFAIIDLFCIMLNSPPGLFKKLQKHINKYSHTQHL